MSATIYVMGDWSVEDLVDAMLSQVDIIPRPDVWQRGQGDREVACMVIDEADYYFQVDVTAWCVLNSTCCANNALATAESVPWEYREICCDLTLNIEADGDCLVRRVGEKYVAKYHLNIAPSR